ncbi:MAG: hypothetical protein GX129_04330 [Clostridiales bacterium]|jgi:L-ascorbate metabolism protein UlaG (beta-lactamase superfamily)|nr:hypothetical protein [Clostridiales bacterium]
MSELIIRNPGVGALLIEAGVRRILVDAFNTLINPIDILPGDIILFTHDDGDHFSPDKIPFIKGQNITILGPPSIVKPILVQEKVDLNQIEVLYSNSYAEPSNITFDSIKVTCYHTYHFNHWDPIHNSYLLEIFDKRLYITGDSLLTKEIAEIIGEMDAIVCNLVEQGYLKGLEESEVAIHHTLSYLLKVRTEGRAKKVIGIHLQSFPWSVDEHSMRELVKLNDFRNIIIPISPDEEITI